MRRRTRYSKKDVTGENSRFERLISGFCLTRFALPRFTLAGLLALSVLAGLVQVAAADAPKVLDATVEVQANGLYAFSVTVVHAEDGWSHYVDRWEVVDDSGKVLGSRTLYHPHEKNVPFTRSLANVAAPIGARQVTIRAHCSVDGYGDSELVVELPPR